MSIRLNCAQGNAWLALLRLRSWTPVPRRGERSREVGSGGAGRDQCWLLSPLIFAVLSTLPSVLEPK